MMHKFISYRGSNSSWTTPNDDVMVDFFEAVNTKLFKTIGLFSLKSKKRSHSGKYLTSVTFIPPEMTQLLQSRESGIAGLRICKRRELSLYFICIVLRIVLHKLW